MKINKKYILLSLLTFILLFSTIVGIAKEEVFFNTSVSYNETIALLPSLNYIDHTPIEISQDSEFNASNGVSLGTGSELDPFIIEGWNITVATGHGIFVHDTTAHFVIRNCWINAGDRPFFSYHGIFLNNTSEGTATIENNNCTGNGCGISLVSSSNNFLTNNNCLNNFLGISLVSSSNNSLTNNTCSLNIYDGISLEYSSNNSLTSNTCNSNNYNGIYLSSSSNNSLTSNTCNSNNRYGIYLSSSSNNSLTNNTCTLNNLDGISLLDSSNNNSLMNNNCSNNGDGIFLYASSNNFLTNNICNLNSQGGISLSYDSNTNSLTNNNCSNNNYGIYLSSSSNNSLTSNTCNSNNRYGIGLTYSSNNSLTNNYCSNNNYGIYLLSSDFNVLSWNLLYTNGFGIHLASFTSDSDNNLIHHNNFINNSNSPQANDYGINNQWYDTETNVGNFWSDYSGSGDYLITGSAGSVDPYPTKILLIIDLDGDGMDDGWELLMGLDPTNSSDAEEDLDEDGLTNLYEFQNGLLANNPDTDGDGMPDGWEVENGFNPLVDDANLDLDNDGQSNLEEFLAGTNPNDSKWAVFKAKALPILKIILLILSVIILVPLSVVITKLFFLYKECLPIKVVISNYLNFVIDSSGKISIFQYVYLTLGTHPEKVHRSVVLDNEFNRIKKDLEDYELVEYINNLIDQKNNFILKKAISTLDEAFLSLSGKIAQLENEMKNN